MELPGHSSPFWPDNDVYPAILMKMLRTLALTSADFLLCRGMSTRTLLIACQFERIRIPLELIEEFDDSQVVSLIERIAFIIKGSVDIWYRKRAGNTGRTEFTENGTQSNQRTNAAERTGRIGDDATRLIQVLELKMVEQIFQSCRFAVVVLVLFQLRISNVVFGSLAAIGSHSSPTAANKSKAAVQ